MKISKNVVFNLADTNGRRKDVLNAFNSYLTILKSLQTDNCDFRWGNLPNSDTQYQFYKMAIEDSPDAFEKHPIFDELQDKIEYAINQKRVGNAAPLSALLSNKSIKKNIDVNIESRSRHYVNNLKKLGFVDKKCFLTKSGEALLTGKIVRDDIEALLPISDINLIILRQLLNINITGINDGNFKYCHYFPLKYALKLLVENQSVDEETFKYLIQGSTPYNPFDTNSLSSQLNYISNLSGFVMPELPLELKEAKLLPFEIFKKYFKNRKSNKTPLIYYEFYKRLFYFNEHTNQTNFEALINIVKKGDKYLKKAFGRNKPIFIIDDDCKDYVSFLRKNKSNKLVNLNSTNEAIFKEYSYSKHLDIINEYFDITKRILSSTRIFKFKNGFVYLEYRDLFINIFKYSNYLEHIFSFSNTFDENEELFNMRTMVETFNLNDSDLKRLFSYIKLKNNVSSMDVLKDEIATNTHKDFIEHVEEKYSKSIISKLLRMFSDRRNDEAIRNFCTTSAKVPTIFEYVCAIAWYYVTGRKLNLFDAMKLTLDSNFEPLTHAPGGDGDIVFMDSDVVTMLEVSLMDKNAQKRGEAEPVLRHSRNLKANNNGKDTLTVFVGTELDDNTINDWIDLKDSKRFINGKLVTDVKIMPIKNNELADMLDKNIEYDRIYKNIIKELSQIKQPCFGWREKIIDSL